MTSSLQYLLKAIHESKDEQALRSHLVPKVGEYFEAKRWNIFFFDNLEEILRKRLSLKGKALQEMLKKSLSIEHNPVARYLVERHAPVHESLVTSPKVWRTICPRADHWHVMAGPIVSEGQLIGAIGCTRERSMPAFSNQDLFDMSAICLHLSAWASAARAQRSMLKTSCLTPREMQIAELVALGRTNLAIGNELFITENSVKQALKRMFRKLEVSSRAEMVAQLLR